MTRATYKPRDAVARYFDEVLALMRTGHSLPDACRAKPEYPTMHSLRRYAEKDAERLARFREAIAAGDVIRKRSRRNRRAADYDEVLDILATTTDKRVTCIYRKVMPKRLPRQTSIDKRRRADPDFAARYAAVLASRPQDIRPDYGYEPKAKPIPRPDGQLAKALRLNDMYRKIDAVLPHYLDFEDRHDVKYAMIEAVLRGELCIDDAADRRNEFISGFFRAQRRHWFLSLDQEKFESEGSTVAHVDLLTTDTDINWAA